MVYSITFVVVFVDFHKILVKSFRKLMFTKLYTCSFQTLVCFQMIFKFFCRGKEVIELPSFMTTDIQI